MLGSFDDLVAMLTKEDVPYEATPSKRSVRIATHRGGVDGVQVIRWQSEDGVVQFIQSVIGGVPVDRLPAIAEAVARLNHALPIPGLDLGHDNGLVAYRLILWMTPDGEVEPDAVRACFRFAARTGSDMVAILARVAAGEAEASDVVNDARRAAAPPTPHSLD
jgi:hypothetical protein